MSSATDRRSPFVLLSPLMLLSCCSVHTACCVAFSGKAVSPAASLQLTLCSGGW